MTHRRTSPVLILIIALTGLGCTEPNDETTTSTSEGGSGTGGDAGAPMPFDPNGCYGRDLESCSDDNACTVVFGGLIEQDNSGEDCRTEPVFLTCIVPASCDGEDTRLCPVGGDESEQYASGPTCPEEASGYYDCGSDSPPLPPCEQG